MAETPPKAPQGDTSGKDRADEPRETELSDDQAAAALRKIGELEDKLEPRG